MHEQGQLYAEPLEPADESRQDDGRTAEQSLTFEQAFTQLEKIVARLEGGEAALEDSLRLFEDGVRLARFCRAQLDRAETRMRVVVEGREGDDERRIASELESEIGLDSGDETV